MQLGHLEHVRGDGVGQRRQQHRGAPEPLAQGRARQVEALAREALGLPIGWQVVVVLGSAMSASRLAPALLLAIGSGGGAAWLTSPQHWQAITGRTKRRTRSRA